MGHIVQRLGINIGRGWIFVFLLLIAGLLAAYWVGPGFLRMPPPEVQLLAVQDGQVAPEIRVTGELAEAENALRFPLELVATNLGPGTAEPRRVVLNVPGRFRVIGPRGRVTAEVTPGVALRRYVVDLRPTRLAPDSVPQPLAGLEQLWLEPDLPSYYCTTRGDGIPEFIPAPAIDPAALSEVRIFYSVHLLNQSGRSTGLLTVRVDPAQLSATPAPMPPSFPTTMDAAEADMPDVGRLRYRGTRTSWCGDPDQPLELYTAMWEGAGGALVYSMHVGGVPRKRLYDLNGDGVIDLETWDADGDGRFDARRQARFATPELLMPLPPRNPQLREPVTTPADPAWLAVFNDPAGGPQRFARFGPPPGTVVEDTLDAGMPPTAREGAEPMGPAPPPEPEWLAIFDDVAAGPFRFTRRPAPPAPADTVPADTVPTDTVPEDTAPPPPPPPPQPQAPRPLGTPVPPGG